MKKKILAIAMLATVSATSQAQIDNKNVVLIHGFQPSKLGESVSDSQLNINGYNYWSEFWGEHADYRIDWDSNERVEGKTAERVYEKVVNLAQNGSCAQGCIFVTHSTGDLIARYIIDNQKAWLTPLGLEPLKVLTVLDFAGAGGGTELADAAYDVANNDGFYMWPLKKAVEAFLGFYPESDNIGVLNDLRPSKARNLSTSPNTLPRLRFTGTGTEYFGTTGPFIAGDGDGVVPLHSACGASNNKGIESCSSFLAMDGELTSVNGPDSLWVGHYPVLMGDDTHHSGAIGSQKGVALTYLYNNFNVGDVDFNLNTRVDEYSPWWYFGGADYYRYVTNSSQKTMSENVYEAFR